MASYNATGTTVSMANFGWSRFVCMKNVAQNIKNVFQLIPPRSTLQTGRNLQKFEWSVRQVMEEDLGHNAYTIQRRHLIKSFWEEKCFGMERKMLEEMTWAGGQVVI